MSFTGYQQNSLANVKVAKQNTRRWSATIRQKKSERASGVKMECVNIPIIGALNCVFFEVSVAQLHPTTYIGQTHNRTTEQYVRLYCVWAQRFSSENWLFSVHIGSIFEVYCFENVVYRPVCVLCVPCCAMLILSTYSYMPLRIILRTDKSHPACPPAKIQHRAVTSPISLEHVCIVMFDVRQHLYGDFVFKDTFIQLSLMSGTRRMIATCAIRAHLPHFHRSGSPLPCIPCAILLSSPFKSIHNDCTWKLGLEPRLYII